MNVVDCSVLAKLVVVEARREEVRAWFDEAHRNAWHLVAPDILFYELGNVLARAWTQTDPAALAAALEEASALVEMRRPPAEAITAMARQGLTFYDASYVALAKQAGATLVTADAKMAKVARKAGISVKTF
ncbi:MAG: type II toxin-antitoxin system VapC family toxin [Candidatus Thermoplasmatota archaeon]|mgnify:CR=1 FL=1